MMGFIRFPHGSGADLFILISIGVLMVEELLGVPFNMVILEIALGFIVWFGTIVMKWFEAQLLPLNESINQDTESNSSQLNRIREKNVKLSRQKNTQKLGVNSEKKTKTNNLSTSIRSYSRSKHLTPKKYQSKTPTNPLKQKK